MEADPSNLTFLGLMKCPVVECNYICSVKESSTIHWYDVHSECRSATSPEIAVMAEDDNTEDEGDMATEDSDVQVGDIEPLFELAMVICTIKYKREFELGLWTNRPDTEDDAINRAILLQERVEWDDMLEIKKENWLN